VLAKVIIEKVFGSLFVNIHVGDNTNTGEEKSKSILSTDQRAKILYRICTGFALSSTKNCVKLMIQRSSFQDMAGPQKYLYAKKKPFLCLRNSFFSK